MYLMAVMFLMLLGRAQAMVIVETRAVGASGAFTIERQDPQPNVSEVFESAWRLMSYHLGWGAEWAVYGAATVLGMILMISFCGFAWWFSTRVMPWVFWFFWNVLLAVAGWVHGSWRMWRLRNQVIKALSLAPGDVKAPLRYDEKGPYLDLRIEGKVLRVRCDNMELLPLLDIPSKQFAGRESRIQMEKAIAGKSLMKVEKFPGGIVVLRWKACIIGMGCRVTIGSETVLLTAMHVIDELQKDPLDSFIANGDIMLPMFEENSPPMGIAKWSDDLDFCMVKVPDAMWSILGVRALKVNRTESSAHYPARLYGFDDLGRPAMGEGTLRWGAGFTVAYSAPTRHAFSGTPVLVENTVFGVHIGGGQDGDESNYGVQIAPFIPQHGITPETPAAVRRRHELQTKDFEEQVRLAQEADRDGRWESHYQEEVVETPSKSTRFRHLDDMVSKEEYERDHPVDGLTEGDHKKSKSGYGFGTESFHEDRRWRSAYVPYTPHKTVKAINKGAYVAEKESGQQPVVALAPTPIQVQAAPVPEVIPAPGKVQDRAEGSVKPSTGCSALETTSGGTRPMVEVSFSGTDWDPTEMLQQAAQVASSTSSNVRIILTGKESGTVSAVTHEAEKITEQREPARLKGIALESASGDQNVQTLPQSSPPGDIPLATPSQSGNPSISRPDVSAPVPKQISQAAMEAKRLKKVEKAKRLLALHEKQLRDSRASSQEPVREKN
jgi:hypothetical protein